MYNVLENTFGYIGYHLTLFFKKILLSGILLFAFVPRAAAAVLYVVVSDNLRGMSFSQTEIKRIFSGEITRIKTGRVH